MARPRRTVDAVDCHVSNRRRTPPPRTLTSQEKGRQVLNVLVLERIADVLGVPRARMGLSCGETGPESAPVVEEVSETEA